MAGRRSPRRLRPDEEQLWQQIARQTQPLHPERGPVVAEAPKKAAKASRKPVAAGEGRLSDFRVGVAAPEPGRRHDLVPPLSERLAQQPVRMDAKAFGRMKRGKLGVEGRIDLHGLTLAQAHPRLVGFVLDAHAQGKRLVLVITGKGRDDDAGGPMPVRRGALRHQVPQWLGTGVARQVVLQITEAHRRHGGSGAFYVYLRRSGK